MNIEELLFSSLDLVTCVLKTHENELYLGKVVSYLFKVTIEFRCGPLSDSLSVLNSQNDIYSSGKVNIKYVKIKII